MTDETGRGRLLGLKGTSNEELLLSTYHRMNQGQMRRLLERGSGGA